MSLRMVSWALSVPDIRTDDKFVLASMGAWADEDGRVFSSLAPLANRCSLPEQELRGILMRLASRGLVDLAHYCEADDFQVTLTPGS